MGSLSIKANVPQVSIFIRSVRIITKFLSGETWETQSVLFAAEWLRFGAQEPL